MGIFGALITSVSGLNAQAYALENISGNIANSQTTAYKRTDTSFSDLVSGASARQQVSGSTQAFSRATNNLQGDPQNATVDTYMAINGEGFFSVQKPSSTSDGRPVFDGVDLFTRRGDFQLDSNGYLVNGAGYYLRALRIDPVTGNPVGSLPTVVQFQNDFLPAQPTTRIEYRANLATYPLTQSAKADVARSELIDPSYFWANPIATSSPAQVSGHSAALLPDATAKLTGSVDLTAAPAFTAPAGSTLRLNGTAINFTGGETATQVRDAINTAMTGASIPITASIDSTGHLVLTGGNADTAINIDGTSTLSLLNGLGINSGTTNPTNLLTQSAVGQGETLTIGVGGNQQTITFGTGAGEVSTLAELQAAVASAANTLDLNYQVDASGNVSFTARNITDTIAIDGTATLSSFGLSKGTAMPSNGTVRGIDESTFLAQSISGGAVTAYDVNGSPVNLQFRWAKSDSATYGGTDTWNLFYQSNTNAGATDSAWTRVPQTYTFSANGQLTPAFSTVVVPNVTVNGISIGDVSLDHGTGGLTQFADTNGTVSVNRLSQDGYAAGDLVNIAVSSNARIVANYSNGRSAEIAQIPLFSFNAPNMLQKLDGGAFSQTVDSGTAIDGATGTVIGRSLEGSNTDIADEFTKLIVTQQAYAANTRVVTTANEMMQEIMQMSR